MKNSTNYLKRIIIINLLLLTPFLTFACSINAKKTSSYYTEAKQEEIKKNKSNWDKKVSKAEVRGLNKYVEVLPENSVSQESLKALRKQGVLLVQGTVINLQEANQSIIPTTKIVIHIDHVISGNKSLKDKTIKYFTDGGLITKNGYMSPDGQLPEYDGQMLYVKENRYPIPQIGNKVAISLRKGGRGRTEKKKDSLKHYDPRNVEEEYWVYDSKSKKYIINNKIIRDTKGKERAKFQSLFKLTDDVNKSL